MVEYSKKENNSGNVSFTVIFLDFNFQEKMQVDYKTTSFKDQVQKNQSQIPSSMKKEKRNILIRFDSIRRKKKMTKFCDYQKPKFVC